MDQQITINEQYLQKRPLSKSSLSKFRKGPKYYIDYILQPKVEKPEYALGKAVECLLLEPGKFKKKFHLYDNFKKQSNEAKQKWSDMLKMAKDNKLILLTNEEYAQAQLMVRATVENPNCKYWLDNIRTIQHKLNWFHKKTRLPVVGISDFDSLIENQLVIDDIKTDYSGEPENFFKQVYKLDYDIQIGSYSLGYQYTEGQFPEFMFMVITKDAPYDSYMVHVPDKLIEDAKEEFKYLLTAFRYCMDHNLWHMGYDFWLMDVLPYHTLEKPRYFKSKHLTEN